MGDVVSVKRGFARNYLLPQAKAILATKENRAQLKDNWAQLEARNLEKKSEAEALRKKIQTLEIITIEHAGENGHLYGSVKAQKIAALLKNKQNISILTNQILLEHPIKTIGLHEVQLLLHPEVEMTLPVWVARTQGEAKTLKDHFKNQELKAGENPITALSNRKPPATEDHKEKKETSKKPHKDTQSPPPKQGEKTASTTPKDKKAIPVATKKKDPSTKTRTPEKEEKTLPTES